MKLLHLGMISAFSLMVALVPAQVLGATEAGYYRVRVLQEQPLSTRWVEMKGLSAKGQRYLLEYVRGQQPLRTANAEVEARIQDAKILRVEFCRSEGSCVRLQGLYAGRAPF